MDHSSSTVTQLVMAACLLLGQGVHAASFRPLGFMPGAVSPESVAHAVSADGSVVVGGATPSIPGSAWEAFRWTEATGMVGLGGLGQESPWSNAVAVSADGSVVVGTTKPAEGGRTFTAFRWMSSLGMVEPSLPVGSQSIFGRGLSGDGALAVTSGLRLWPSTGDMIPLAIDGQAISANGVVVVGSGDGLEGDAQAAYWTEANGTVLLGHLPGANYISIAYGASADGGVIVGSESNGDEDFDEAFRWTSSTGMVGLGRLPGATGSVARGVSGDGSIVVGSSLTSIGRSEALIWTEAGGLERLLDFLVARGATGLDGWTLFGASAVSQDGNWVVGWAESSTERSQAFLANISAVPLPPAGWLLATGVVGILGANRRRRPCRPEKRAWDGTSA